jgi:hypothetical protein
VHDQVTGLSRIAGRSSCVANTIGLAESPAQRAKVGDGVALQLEESMDKHAVTPGTVTPAREMLAQILFLEGRPQEFLAEYEAALKMAPNRFNVLYGAACAAKASGSASAANRYFQTLTEIAVGDERPELVTARKNIFNHPNTMIQ